MDGVHQVQSMLAVEIPHVILLEGNGVFGQVVVFHAAVSQGMLEAVKAALLADLFFRFLVQQKVGDQAFAIALQDS